MISKVSSLPTFSISSQLAAPAPPASLHDTCPEPHPPSQVVMHNLTVLVWDGPAIRHGSHVFRSVHDIIVALGFISSFCAVHVMSTVTEPCGFLECVPYPEVALGCVCCSNGLASWYRFHHISFCVPSNGTMWTRQFIMRRHFFSEFQSLRSPRSRG